MYKDDTILFYCQIILVIFIEKKFTTLIILKFLGFPTCFVTTRIQKGYLIRDVSLDNHMLGKMKHWLIFLKWLYFLSKFTLGCENNRRIMFNNWFLARVSLKRVIQQEGINNQQCIILTRKESFNQVFFLFAN